MIRLLLGALIGLGVFGGLSITWRFAVPRHVPLATAIAAIQRPARRSTNSWWERLMINHGRIPDEKVLQDLAVLNRTDRDFALMRLRLVATFGGTPAILGTVCNTTQVVSWSPVMIVGLSILGACGGFLLAKSMVAADAETRRRGFVVEIALYIDMVSLLLASGAGVDEALWRACRNGTSSGITMIRDSLSSARVRQEPPWWAFEDLAKRTGVNELAELVGSIKQSGASGAQIRQSLASRGASLRSKGNAQELGRAERDSEKMGLPQVVLLTAFMILVLAPGVASILRFGKS
jgi:tight adherence protein C